MLRSGLALLAAFALAAPLVAAPDSKPPNVIVFLIDDMGAVDLGCYGNTFHETPHLDQFARDSQKFTAGYSACTVCSPTRAALLTGQYPARLHITDWIAGHKRPFAKLNVPDWTMHLPTETFNLARGFRDAGYVTASVGKWHLGGPEFYPEKQGFHTNIAGTDKGSPPSYLPPFKIPTLEDKPGDVFLSDRLTTEAISWMTANKEKPFFLYFPHYAVHTPIMGKPAVVAKYKAKAEKLGLQKNVGYAALVESVDDSVGAIRQALANLKLDDRTIIIFTSDNGGLERIHPNPPFRAGKGSAYEGGVRVPFIVNWPGVTKPGATDATPIMTIDILPTLAEACGWKIPDGTPVDGVSLVSLLRGTGKPGRDSLFWHYPHYHPGGATPYSAARFGDWRIVEFFEDGRIELYNLRDDVSESKDLAAMDPVHTKQLTDRLRAWRTSVKAQLPTPNPNADPIKDQQKPPVPKKP